MRMRLLLIAVLTASAARGHEGIEFFGKKIRPLLVENCYSCHSVGAKKVRGGLLLDSREGHLKGGDNGAALSPGSPEKSRLIEAVGYKNIDLRMPPRAKLTDAAVADLTTWVRMGAPWPKEKGPDVVVKDEFDLQKRKKSHWAWKPIAPSALPVVRDKAWPRDPIDNFILAKLDEKGLAPAADADRRVLVRRLYFDLIGLPPTPEELDKALADKAPDWPASTVDELLKSPRFGERWGRHWLDLVRYGESRGHEFEPNIPNAWQYRDYVIRALNADVPYDQFVVEHLAGDLVEKPRTHPVEGFNEAIIGTGFWFLGEEVHSPVDIRQDQADRFDNRIDVMTKTFLGLTVSCARCHDHKFDAISTKDYYGLFGFLESSNYRLARFDTMSKHRALADDLSKLRRKMRETASTVLKEQLRPGIERTADYLTAAREVMLVQGDRREKQETTAKERKLDPARLALWVAALQTAAKDVRDPLHAWAKVATDPAANDQKRLVELLKPMLDSGKPIAQDGIVIDYEKADARAWLPDGESFGTGPVRAGELVVGGDAAKTTLSVQDRGAAVKDSAFDRLANSPEGENDPNGLGFSRAGRTIRTPTFTVTKGRVHYLVRGTGRAYAAVGQHAVIAGPLHGQLIVNLKTGPGWQWISHDLTRYRGLRAHIEFTATGKEDFAVAMVAQGDQPPPLVEKSDGALVDMLAGVRTLDALAKGYQSLLLETLERPASDRARLLKLLVERRALFGDVEKPLSEALKPLLAEQATLTAQIKPTSRLALAIQDGSGVDENVFIRGSYKTPGPVVPRRFLEALSGPDPMKAERGSGRLELARRMIDPSVNPFISRVFVNRVWHHLYGRGIVGSTDNFGVLGEAPTHPELLDHLADTFVKDGWSLKKLIRRMVLTRAYRMSSAIAQGKADEVDPQNLLLHRSRIRRLEGEVIRDSILALSGRLDVKMYGRSVPVHLTPFQDGRGKPGSGPLDGDGRRSIYLAVRRNFLSSFLLAFDTPIPFSTVGKRTVSNVPAQALILMNDPFVHQQAALWGRKVSSRPGTNQERIANLYVSAFARPPREDELKSCQAFLDQQARAAGLKPEDPAVWADLAHVLINVKEFIFLE